MPCDDNKKIDRDLERLLAGSIDKAVGVARAGPGAAPATNLALDVALVQGLLNRIPKPRTAAKSLAPLPVNGKCDRATVDRIKAFQAEFLSIKSDGRIDPNGKTWKKLVAVSKVRLNKQTKQKTIFGDAPVPFVRAGVDRARLRDMTKRHLGLQNKNERMADFLKLLFADPTVKKLRWIAYYLATVHHETTFTFKPVREAGEGRGQPYSIPVSVTDTHGYRGPKGKIYQNVYYGRGFVQLTWPEAYNLNPASEVLR